MPSLCDFVERYEYSRSVVLEHRAAAYFDFSSGVRLSAFKEGAEIRVLAEVETNGPPRLRVPLFRAAIRRLMN